MITLIIIFIFYILSVYLSIKLDDYLYYKDSESHSSIPMYVLIIPFVNLLIYLVFTFIVFIENKIE